MRSGYGLCATFALLASACSGSSSSFSMAGGFPTMGTGIVASDERAPVRAPSSPPPISGGTLLVTHDGHFAVAADPDRNRVSVVSIEDRILLHTIPLEVGDEPGRVVEDAWGMIHVALRRGGAVATIDPEAGVVLRRTATCGAPRGIAYESTSQLVHVACAGGELVSLDARGDVVRRIDLGPDLRDVVVTPSGLVVSRFKSAALITLDADGNRTADFATQRIGHSNPLRSITSGKLPAGQPDTIGMDPVVAWKTVAAPNGDVVVLHQYGLSGPVGTGTIAAGAPPPTAYYGSASGSAPGCAGLIAAGVTTVTTGEHQLVLPDGKVSRAPTQVMMGAQISGAPLTVDASVSPDGKWVALAHAGTLDPGTLDNSSSSGFLATAKTGGQISVMNTFATAGQDPASANCATPEISLTTGGQVTAVAFNPTHDPNQFISAQQPWLIAQSREPATLVFVSDETTHGLSTIELGGPSMLDTGHDIFHRDTGAGIACAQCHVEGGEDGRVWKFTPEGSRRTQALHIGISGTEPFHWDGALSNLGALMDEVFVGRMAGPKETPAREDALKDWLDGLAPPAAIADASSPQAARGKALFESADVGCNSCHSGDKHTNNTTVFVGTTEPDHLVQVPSLVGVGYRAPFIHNGCAATLRDRFDPKCGGGDLHGKTSGLTEAQMGDLIAYLETL
jgi:hypothetical protein